MHVDDVERGFTTVDWNNVRCSLALRRDSWQQVAHRIRDMLPAARNHASAPVALTMYSGPVPVIWNDTPRPSSRCNVISSPSIGIAPDVM